MAGSFATLRMTGFENLDGGLGILGKSNERPNEKNKQNPLQRSVHMSPIEVSQSKTNRGNYKLGGQRC